MACLHFVLSYRYIEDSERALIVCYGIKRVIENGDEGTHVQPLKFDLLDIVSVVRTEEWRSRFA